MRWFARAAVSVEGPGSSLLARMIGTRISARSGDIWSDDADALVSVGPAPSGTSPRRIVIRAAAAEWRPDSRETSIRCLAVSYRVGLGAAAAAGARTVAFPAIAPAGFPRGIAARVAVWEARNWARAYPGRPSEIRFVACCAEDLDAHLEALSENCRV